MGERTWLDIATDMRRRSEEVRRSLPEWTGTRAEAISACLGLAPGMRVSTARGCFPLQVWLGEQTDNDVRSMLDTLRHMDALDQDEEYGRLDRERIRLLGPR